MRISDWSSDVCSSDLCVAHHFWRIAYQTDSGRHDQESHDQQKPPTIVNMPDRELVEQGKPEGAELVDVVIGRLILMKHCDDQARHANEHQQTDRKADRAQQLDDISAKTMRGGRVSNR